MKKLILVLALSVISMNVLADVNADGFNDFPGQEREHKTNGDGYESAQSQKTENCVGGCVAR